MSLQIQTSGKGPWGPARGFPSLQGQNVKSRGPACVYKHVCSGDRVPYTAYQEDPLLGKSRPAQRHGEQTTGAPRLVTLPSATVNLAPTDPMSLRNPSGPWSFARALPFLLHLWALVNCHLD